MTVHSGYNSTNIKVSIIGLLASSLIVQFSAFFFLVDIIGQQRLCKKNRTGLMRHYAKTINNMKSSYTLFLYRHIVGNFPQKFFFHIYNGFWYFDQYTFSLLLHIQPFLHDFFSAKKNCELTAYRGLWGFQGNQ